MKTALGLLAAVCLLVVPAIHGQIFNQLYSFNGSSDGGHPFSNVIRDSSGNLYGTAFDGGVFGNCPYPGCGVVFKVDSSGNETPLYTFVGPPTDGEHPVAGLAADSDGNLYGTTAYGGVSNYGTAFKIDPAGNETLLHVFGGGSDGGIPNGGVIRDASGNLYGTTFAGGSAGFGTVFKINPGGVFSTVYSFPDRAHGTNPNATLFLDVSGNLYGTTQYGGAFNRGTIFRLDSNGAETVLHSFEGADGAYPQSALTPDGAGNFYGTTTEGGAANLGTVFQFSATGTLTLLHSFTGSPDGVYPMSGVIRDSAGNLYGTTFRGGRNTGTVYKLDASGNETVLYTFEGSFDGASPAASLLLDPTASSVYGTGTNSGFGCCGVVFQVTLP